MNTLRVITTGLLLASLTGCSQSSSTTSTASATQPTSHTPAKVIQKTVDKNVKHNPNVINVARQGGLGDTFEQAKKVFGEPNRTNQALSGGVGQYNYQSDLEVVTYSEGRISNIAFQLDTQHKQMSMAKAKQFASSMIPTDSTKIKEYDKDTNTHIILYHSKALESLFDSQEFQDKDGNVKPGQFDVALNHMGDEVGSMEAMLGDNP